MFQAEVPSHGPGEVTIEVRAAGVNPIDYKLYSGAFGNSPDNLPVRSGAVGLVAVQLSLGAGAKVVATASERNKPC